MKIARRSSLVFSTVLIVLIGGGVSLIGGLATPFGYWIGVIPAVFIVWNTIKRSFARWRVSRERFPEEWRDWLERSVMLYSHLHEANRERFERDIKFVLSEWVFEGVGSVEVTDRLRLSVATGVALLLHGRPDWELAPRHTVLFYPDRFDQDYFDGDYAEYDGMAHAQGPIILSVRAVERSWSRPQDGDNVVLHELAHLFDFHNAYADGVPSLIDRKSAGAWLQLVRQEMRRAHFGRSVLRRYAGTSEAELFAVATENFFERPGILYRRHPELYAALCSFYNIDPAVVLGEEKVTEEPAKE